MEQHVIDWQDLLLDKHYDGQDLEPHEWARLHQFGLTIEQEVDEPCFLASGHEDIDLDVYF